ncbi:KUP/HAK/KT family potassium transporter [Nonomuraea helvata]|uniref:KUP/HAK/KT family potassium transporter n=1 Tax=Nonomuraea helvata TaxID=37484 RepID=UPI003CD0894E
MFGDIGTSPIYTFQTVFNPSDPHPVPVSTENVFGVVSLVFWSVMIIVTVTYVLLAMLDSATTGGGCSSTRRPTSCRRSSFSAGMIRRCLRPTLRPHGHHGLADRGVEGGPWRGGASANATGPNAERLVDQGHVNARRWPP